MAQNIIFRFRSDKSLGKFLKNNILVYLSDHISDKNYNPVTENKNKFCDFYAWLWSHDIYSLDIFDLDEVQNYHTVY